MAKETQREREKEREREKKREREREKHSTTFESINRFALPLVRHTNSLLL